MMFVRIRYGGVIGKACGAGPAGRPVQRENKFAALLARLDFLGRGNQDLAFH